MVYETVYWLQWVIYVSGSLQTSCEEWDTIKGSLYKGQRVKAGKSGLTIFSKTYITSPNNQRLLVIRVMKQTPFANINCKYIF